MVFSEEQIRQFQEAFLVFDKDCNGHITCEELGVVMMALGQRPSLQELEALIRGADLDNSGTVDFAEFLQMMSRKLSSSPEEELREVFDVIDVRQDGYICAAELHNILVRLGEHVSMDDVQEMIIEADVDKDGRISFDDFKALLTSK